jgi:protein-S-isoprenylcysteine O-methyltransferase Ste14
MWKITEIYIRTLNKFADKDRSLAYRYFSLAAGSVFFIYIVPIVLILLGNHVVGGIHFRWPRYIEILLALVLMPAGIFIMSWAILVQWVIGGGTPFPGAPTKRLITAGPYGFVRNPIQLGANLYYFGAGTLVSSLNNGLFCFAVGFTIGSLYHKFIEEKELEMRFDEEYREYKNAIPFIIPICRKHNKLKGEQK